VQKLTNEIDMACLVECNQSERSVNITETLLYMRCAMKAVQKRNWEPTNEVAKLN
jgi:hypothetical protein